MIRSCNITIYYRLLIYSNLVVGANVLDENGFLHFLTVAGMIFFLLVLTIAIFLTTRSRTKICWVGSIRSGRSRVSC